MKPCAIVNKTEHAQFWIKFSGNSLRSLWFYGGSVFKFDYYHIEIEVTRQDIRGVPITQYIFLM